MYIYSFSILAFVVGSLLGSFLNVVIDRLSTGRSIVGGRSYCEYCKKTLKPYDLIPVVSFILLGGKCRFCKKKIPLRICVVEILSGITFSLLFFSVLIGSIMYLAALLLGILLLCFIGIFFADIEYGIIPDGLVVVSLLTSALYIVLTSTQLSSHLLSGTICFGFFLLLFIITRGRGMGFGDVKLSFVLGLLLGFPNIIVCLYLAFLTGAGVSIILVVCRKIRFFGSTIPFGPFLIASSLVSLFWGQNILTFFTSRFL